MGTVGWTCGSLECVDANDDACGPDGLQSAVSWNAKAGQTYHILVTAYGDGPKGDFMLTVQRLEQAHDICDNAMPISMHEHDIGDMVGVKVPLSTATVDAENLGLASLICPYAYGEFTDDWRGMWYSVVGSGLAYKAEVSGGDRFV